MEKEIIFVTHNKGKVKSAEKYFKNIKLSTVDFELDEPRSDDIQEIAKSKVCQAYEMVRKPCIELDTYFRIDEWYIFKPKGFDKTLAEMNEQERDNRREIDGYYSAMEKFAEWYQEK